MKAFKYLLVTTVALGLFAAFGSDVQSEPTAAPSIDIREVATGFSQPTGIASTGVLGDDRLFVLEKTGKIKILEKGVVYSQAFLDLEGQVDTLSERGLLGLAFDPNYEQSGYFYINYSDARDGTVGDTIVKRFTVSSNPNVADADSGETIIEIEQDFSNHNGGWLAFDNDGQLIIGMGDGGSSGDPNNRAQSKDSLLGKMVRINVSGSGLPPTDGCGRVTNYLIPEDNPRPFGSDGWCPEIWSYGVRNPWRFSFDRQTGDMWMGDVGQVTKEEINFQALGTPDMLNYGWRCHEGLSLYNPASCTIPENERTDPVTDYGRSEGGSVTGGYVYRGQNFPALNGHYIYGDFVSGQLWSIEKDNNFGVTTQPDTSLLISAFGEASDGSLYVVDFAGGIYEVISDIGARVDMSVSGLVEVGGTMTFRLTVSNIGTEDLSGLTLGAEVPQGVTYQSGGTESAGMLSFEIGTLAAGETRTLTWVGTADSVGTIVSNSLSANADQLNSPISISGIQQTSVVDEIFPVYVPLATR
ncbi:MAG: PQQ-dependent sugar dehydrogenase [Chloroflexota bacterium]